jgi:DNA-binding response OmpR family regulator
MAEQHISPRERSVDSNARVLSVGYLVEQLQDRNQRLRKAGFTVDSTSDSDRAFALASANHYDCTVLGLAVPESVRNDIAAAVREKNPAAIVVMLYWGSIQNAELADAVLSVKTSDDDLQSILKHLLAIRSGVHR